ncbi:MAG: EAL domain-containing protein [Oscillospiraceae bacterium]
MQYIVDYNVCAFFFLIIISMHYFTRKQFPRKQNMFFSIFIIIGGADLILDIVTAYTISFSDTVPAGINIACNMLFYALQMILMPMLYLFVLCLTHNFLAKNKRKIALSLLPVLVCAVILAVTPFTGAFFYIDTFGKPTHGSFFPVFYMASLFYFIATICILVSQRKKLHRSEFITILSFMLFSVAAVLLQLLFPHYLLTGMALVLSISMMYLTLQNPDAMLDPVTNTFNRAGFRLCIEDSIADARSFRIIAVQLREMRSINSLFGLSNTDKAKLEVGRFLQKNAGSENVFRISESTFAVTVFSGRNCAALSHTIARRFERPFAVEALEIRFNASVFFSEELDFCKDDTDVITLLEYCISKAKPDSGNCQLVITHENFDCLHREVIIETDIKAAIANGIVEVFYQPLFCISTGKFIAAEALARYRHKAFGSISPSEFIPIAERNGSVVRLGELVLSQTCELLKANSELLSDFKSIEINLSPIECLKSNLAENIIRTVASYGVSPDKLNFEITETAATVSREIISRNMEALVSEGFRFSLDDFGTGYANIDSVIALPFSMIKLDRSMLLQSVENEKSAIVFRNTLNMAHELGLSTVVEGVETKQQLCSLEGSSVDYIQGYYCAGPMPANEFLEFIRANKR